MGEGWSSGPSRQMEGQLWIRSLDAVTAQPLAGTENGYLPIWSPDGISVGFVADGKLKRIEAAGGPVLTLAEIGFGADFGGSWSSEGTIVSPGPVQRRC